VTGRPDVTPETVFRHRSDLRLRRYRGRLFIAAGKQALELEEVAESIFRRVDGKASVRDIAETLAAHYDVPAGEVVAQSLELLVRLAEFGVLEAVG
jgi:pyrroloquinoline quinone biosynthesis protein D